MRRLGAALLAVSLAIGALEAGAQPLLSVPVIEAGQARISWTGEAGRNYRLEASADLEQWQPLTIGSSPGGQFEFQEALAAGPRFYRVLDLDSTGLLDFPVGALLGITSDFFSVGPATEMVLEIGAKEINSEHQSAESPLRVRMIVEDTRFDPALALERLQALAAQGVKVVIGPETSAETQAIKSFADEQGIIILSNGSTASSLAIPGDNIFRFVPVDTQQARAIVALLKDRGVQAIVPVWRNDGGNNELHGASTAGFQQEGGTVIGGFRYEPDTTDFASAVAALRAGVIQAVGQFGTNGTAVFVSGFDEVVLLMKLAAQEPELASVRWYGTDGIVQSVTLINDLEAAAFAAAVEFVNPNFGMDEGARDRWEPLIDRVRDVTGIEPNAFSFTAYDALRVAASARSAIGVWDAESFKAALVSAADDYQGLTGRTTLNAAGDRDRANYDYWAVRFREGGYVWEKVGSF